MRVLITGGAGYIGNELVYGLSAAEGIDEIIVYDNLNKGNYNLFTGLRKLPNPNVTFIQGDILDSRNLKAALEGVDVVFHLAANVTTPFADQNPHFFEQVNHWGTAELTYALEESDVKKWVYMSSTSVYGAGGELATIDKPLNPRTYYGVSKMRGEDHAWRLRDKLETYIVRCGNVYGYSKNMRFDAVINKFLFEAHFLKKIQVYGDGTQSRAFIDINRVTDFLHKLIVGNVPSGKFNLVDRNLEVLEIAETMKDLYPELEMIFINHHLAMRNLTVEQDEVTKSLIGENPMTLHQELEAFREKFTF